MPCWPSSCGGCSQVGQHSLVAPPPLREGSQPAALSTYARFWTGGTQWRRFLRPGEAQGEAIAATKGEAGVYEFGVSMPQSHGTIVTVYVGKSNNVRSRHLAYLNTGSHLKEYLHPAVQQGCTVWQRVRYLVSPRPVVRTSPANGQRSGPALPTAPPAPPPPCRIPICRRSAGRPSA